VAPTIREVAKRANVGIGTVSRVINHADHVSQATRNQVELVMHELGFTPNPHARNLKRQTVSTLGFFFTSTNRRPLSDPFLNTLITGLADAASVVGFDLLVASSREESTELAQLERLVAGNRVAGLIFTDTRVDDARVKLLRRRKKPFVAFGRIEPASAGPSIDVDGREGVLRAMKHLFVQGHTCIGLITLPDFLTCAQDRLQGYRDAYAWAQRPLEAHYIVRGGLTESDGCRAAEELMALPSPPTAIVACSDVLALGAMRVIQQRGMALGRDMALVGFDDIPVAAYTAPPLTTLRQPIYEIASELVHMLVRHINGEPVTSRVIQPELVIRESTSRRV
jgi:DNA-binding LacI/PurR family transcriptional regulator